MKNDDSLELLDVPTKPLTRHIKGFCSFHSLSFKSSDLLFR